MSVLLEEALREATELRQAAEREWRRALVRAADGGLSLRAIAHHAGVTFTVVGYHLRKARGDTKT